MQKFFPKFDWIVLLFSCRIVILVVKYCASENVKLPCKLGTDVNATGMHSSRVHTTHFGDHYCLSVLDFSVQGGLHPEWRPPPPVNGMTDRCKNITFPQLRWWVVNICPIPVYPWDWAVCAKRYTMQPIEHAQTCIPPLYALMCTGKWWRIRMLVLIPVQ